LLIEDSEDDALLTLHELESDGYELDYMQVDTPQALAEALEKGFWDVIISDYNMPSFSGFDALKIVEAKGMDIPLILISGAIGEEQAVEAMKAGFHDFVMKDRLSRLPQALKRELKDAKVRQERREALASLRKAHAELEQRVIERTAELTIANKKAQEINERLRLEIEERKRAEEELKKALAEIKTLRGIVPICSNCKKIRDDHGFWKQVEVYVEEHTEALFSHGLCAECAKKLYPDLGLDYTKHT
jgi:DNA-binding NtrC family response regulator